MAALCPACGSSRVRFSKRRNSLEYLASLVGYCPIRCRDCGRRFWHGLLISLRMPYARCPRCLRDDLTDWAERYYYPKRFSRFLLKLGASQQRCSVCRVNFVSFLPRRTSYVNPAKLKKLTQSNITQDLTLMTDELEALTMENRPFETSK